MRDSSLWFIWFIGVVWFNQTIETDQINQTDPITVFLRWRTFPASHLR